MPPIVTLVSPRTALSCCCSWVLEMDIDSRSSSVGLPPEEEGVAVEGRARKGRGGPLKVCEHVGRSGVVGGGGFGAWVRERRGPRGCLHRLSPKAQTAPTRASGARLGKLGRDMRRTTASADMRLSVRESSTANGRGWLVLWEMDPH